jgi:preprotein translocase SecF subunit
VNYKYDFVKVRNKFFAFSIFITIIGIIMLLTLGLNFGVDFKAGTNLDITINETITNTEASSIIEGASGLKPSVITVGGDNQDRVTARFDKVLSDDERLSVINGFKAQYKEVSYEENTVDVTMAKELGQKAIYAVLIASVFIILYVIIRFEWRFALAAVIALFHDAFIVISIFSIFRLEVNLPFVAAVLTIIGYSINDTIVTFDRIRENLKFAKIKTFDDLAELVNRSIWQTMSRSINTVLTVIFAAGCLFIFGSESIRIFSLAMLLGLVSGAYSSFFIASQLWLIMKAKTMHRKPVTIQNS